MFLVFSTLMPIFLVFSNGELRTAHKLIVRLLTLLSDDSAGTGTSPPPAGRSPSAGPPRPASCPGPPWEIFLQRGMRFQPGTTNTMYWETLVHTCLVESKVVTSKGYKY